MKHHIALLFFILLFSFDAHSQLSKECLERVKIGRFEYRSSDKTITVIRTKKRQIETYNNGKSKLINRIKWISNTTYITTFVKEVNASGCLQRGDKMTMTILACDGDKYTVVATSENCGGAKVEVTILGN